MVNSKDKIDTTEQKNPIVSIIVPNHNYGQFIADAIESIKAQTLTDWECIIIDDASTDDSVEVAKKTIGSDKRFKIVVNKESLGVSAARNIGLDMATGEWIAFLDSDDCYAEYFLEMLVKLARKTRVDICGATTKFVPMDFKYVKPEVKENNAVLGTAEVAGNKPENTESVAMSSAESGVKAADDKKAEPVKPKWNTDDYIILEKPNDMRKQPEKRKWLWIWRRIYKRELLKDVRFHDVFKTNGDDITFMMDFLYRVPRITESNIDGVYHRVHPFSISSVYQDFKMERVQIFPYLFKHVRENLADKYDEEFIRSIQISLFMYLLSECLIKSRAQTTDKNLQRELRELLRNGCRELIKKYLPFKHRLLCRYLIWKK